jgi:signal transduction histidine kinase
MQALTHSTLATVPTERFAELALAQRAVVERVIRQVRPVVDRLSAVERNRERLASLGTMAAGLAHELNNPAAAARRAAADLVESLDILSSTIGHFVESGIERVDAQKLVDLQREAMARQAQRGPLDALDAADAEDELLGQLEDLGVPEAWRLAEPLASAGVDADWLARVSGLAGEVTAAALRWVAASLTARGLASELTESTARMSDLVGAVKSYAYMDRGEVVEADVHEGLETTLTVLGHKLKHTTIEVVREYDRSLPALTMRGSELNQVWTNLLDNAIDALGERGTITLSTHRDGQCVQVDIADDGPGIAPEARAHIFDPFFTTKDVGQGTGLGLDTARRIVADRHRGTIAVDSEPGHTVFHVRLPLQGAAGSPE